VLKKIKPHLLAITTIIFFAILGSAALFKSGFYTSHDGEHQLIRQYVFDKALKAGHIPPRFDRQLQNNLGYPLFTFTYQFPFWIGETLIYLGLAIPDAIKGVFIITYLASGLAMYIFSNDRWGKTAAVVSAFLYLWAPYRFLTMLVRAQLGEHTALLFIPLLFFAFNKNPLAKARIIIGSLSIAGLLLSHSMVAQMSFLAFIIFWSASLFYSHQKISFIKHSLLVGLLGIALAAFYLVPATHYRSNINNPRDCNNRCNSWDHTYPSIFFKKFTNRIFTKRSNRT